MALHVHRSEQLEPLVTALGGVLADPPADPFGVDVVAVPAKGMERWVAQRLSLALGTSPGRQDGVCAGVRFPLISDVIAEATTDGVDRRDDPWHPRALAWHVIGAFETVSVQAGAEPLSSYLSGGPRRTPGSRRVTAGIKVARLFDSYLSARPDMVNRWDSGEDVGPDGAQLRADAVWQALLWRAVSARVGVASPAARLAADCERIRTRGAELPDRVSLFGLTRLTLRERTVLAALAVRHEVHVWLAHPSPALWAAIAALPSSTGPRRRGHPAARVPRNRLLASLGRETRELQLVLRQALDENSGVTDVHHAPRESVDIASTALQQLQDDLRCDREQGTRPPLTAYISRDDSIRVHSCHGRQRQVEVLREVVLGLLADDSTLEPRDIIVMCPRVSDFASLLTAAFGAVARSAVGTGSLPDATDDYSEEDSHPGQTLHLSIADRSPVEASPVLTVLRTLLALPGSRVTAADLIDLLALPPVAARFRLDDTQLSRLRAMVRDSGIRWGLDGADREPFGLAAYGENSWEAGLDRLLLGVAMSEPGAMGRVGGLPWTLPFDDVSSVDVAVVGALAELVARVRAFVRAADKPRPVDSWATSIMSAVESLTLVSAGDSWQLAQARSILRTLPDAAGPAGLSQLSVTLAEVRALLAEELADRPTRVGFRTGSLTVCTMVPMRSVPHRVVCLLGIDDGDFPRAGAPDGDDLLALDPHVGERDARLEDRQLLLDAVLAAREKLVVLYTGRDPRTNAEVPPCVPLGELLDAIDTPSAGSDGTDTVVVRQPLQPFDRRNFVPATLGTPGPFSFDQRARAAAGVASGGIVRGPIRALAADDNGTVDLDDLIRFVANPVKAFFRTRLGVTVLGDEGSAPDRMPLSLVGLAEWEVGDRILAAMLAGADVVAVSDAERKRGSLPPGGLADPLLAPIVEAVDALVREARQIGLTPAPRSIPVQIRAGDADLTGTVAGVHASTVARVTYSRLRPEARLRAWVQLIALTVAYPETSWSAVTVARPASAAGERRSAVCRISPVSPREAQQALDRLVHLYRLGMRVPLPYGPRAGVAYHGALMQGKSEAAALGIARSSWRRTWDSNPRADLDDPVTARAWGGYSIEQLAAMTSDDLGLTDTLLPQVRVFPGVVRVLWGDLWDVERPCPR